MILVLLGITILMTAGGIIWGYKNDWYGLGEMFLTIFGVIGVVVVSIFTICLAYDVSTAKVVDEKIAMYQAENEVIETQVAEAVKQYQEYEQGVFNDVAQKDVVALVMTYPELKSNELVVKQISVYVANNNKIKELKEEKINASVNRWWLYFGA